jgi:hypothetical protein
MFKKFINRIKDFFASLGSSITALVIVAAAFLAGYLVVNFGGILLSNTIFRDVRTREVLEDPYWLPPGLLPLDTPDEEIPLDETLENGGI